MTNAKNVSSKYKLLVKRVLKLEALYILDPHNGK
jgi:hypothetical protein